MNGRTALFVVCALLVAGVAGSATGSALAAFGTPDQAAQSGPPGVASNESGEPPAPGAHLSGLVDVQEAEIEGGLASRAFGLQIAGANSNASKVAIVAEQVADLNRQTDELRERRRALIEARQNGTISQARFRAEMATLAARTGVVEHRLDRTEATARGLPNGLLESNGVNATAIRELRNDTREVSGRDTAEIATSITGPNVGRGLATTGNSSVDPPTDGSVSPNLDDTASDRDDENETDRDSGLPTGYLP